MDRVPCLPRQQRVVFSAIYAEPALYVRQLARRLGMERSSVDRIVLILERKGLIVTHLERRPAQQSVPAHFCRILRPAPWTLR